MTALQTIQKIGSDAVRKLRLQKLRNGRPFMINSKDLPSNKCYLEFPDGNIKLVQLDSAAKDFIVLRTLSASEEQKIRRKYDFPRI